MCTRTSGIPGTGPYFGRQPSEAAATARFAGRDIVAKHRFLIARMPRGRNPM